ncbi:MAG: SH3 domain-containing protein [Gammaproteobacteria bacterium]|nr:SH3 domain-containing protein [Gammaproteobacteria bacterium]
MRLLTLLFILLQNVVMTMTYAEDTAQLVKVADPFLEMHTGPSVGYPITNVIKRDETISIIKQRTTWYLIKNNKDYEGWVHRSQLVKTLTLDDEEIEIKDITREDYLDHKWEMSMIGGNFGSLPMMTLSGGYALTKNLSTEASFTQIIGNFSSRQLLGINLINQPFPDWKISPYFSLGGGIISTRVKSTLSQLEDDTDFTANVSLGLKMYLTRSFLIRTDLKKHIIFQSRDKNEEITSWQVGFAVFF